MSCLRVPALLVLLLSTNLVFAAGYIRTNLVSDQAGTALITDPLLVNPWGIALTASSPFWVANNGTSTSTLYRGDAGATPFSKNAGLASITIPGSLPTGTVANSTADFVITSGMGTGPARFLFVTQNGTVVGWNPNVPAAGSTTGVVAATHMGSDYRGIALGNNGTSNFLYVADFANNKIDVYDKNYALTTLAGSFTDPTLPSGYAPFNIQNLGGTLYVAYALVDPMTGDSQAGAGNGYVSRFDTNGNFLNRLVSNGPLNAPWGLAIASGGFGTFSGALLVGNFGDGTVNAFNPTTGAFLGTLSDPLGNPIVIDGLWGITMGNGGNGGDVNTLYFASGPASESHGLFGKLTFNASAATTTLVGTGTAISATEGAAFTATVAVFSDADGTGTHTAMINWGDSSSSTGTITSAGNGNYLVSGSHTYGEEAASQTITVTMNDTSDGATGTATGSAAIADAPLTGSPSNVSFIPAVPFTAAVARFTDADPGGTASDYTATIDWGDATPPTAGTITANGTGFTVSGSHTYAMAGNYTITVTIHDVGGAQTVVTSMAGLSVPAIDPRGLLLLALALAGVGIFVIRRT